VTLPGSEGTICVRENIGHYVKEVRNLEDDTFQVFYILTLFKKPSLHEKYLVLLALGQKEPGGNGDFNAGISEVNMISKNIAKKKKCYPYSYKHRYEPRC